MCILTALAVVYAKSSVHLEALLLFLQNIQLYLSILADTQEPIQDCPRSFAEIRITSKWFLGVIFQKPLVTPFWQRPAQSDTTSPGMFDA
jgi:hypothetical protein